MSGTAWLGDPALQAGLHGFGALVFAAAAHHKLRDPGAFRAALSAYGLLPDGAVPAVAGTLAMLEVAVAVALLIPGAGSVAALGGATLLALYASAITANLFRGRYDIECGCGGAGGERPLGADLVARNAVLVGVLLVAAVPATGRAPVWLDIITAVGLAAGLGLAHAAFDVALANTARLHATGGPAWATR